MRSYLIRYRAWAWLALLLITPILLISVYVVSFSLLHVSLEVWKSAMRNWLWIVVSGIVTFFFVSGKSAVESVIVFLCILFLALNVVSPLWLVMKPWLWVVGPLLFLTYERRKRNDAAG